MKNMEKSYVTLEEVPTPYCDKLGEIDIHTEGMDVTRYESLRLVHHMLVG